MADVIGPNSYLPGRILRTENMIKGHNCDQCSCTEPPVEKPAVAAMIAETEEGSCGRLYYLCEQHRSVLLSSFVDDDDCSPQHYGYDD